MNTTSVAIAANRSREGMFCVSFSLFLFSFQDMIIKSFSDKYSVLQIVCLRSLLAFTLLCIFGYFTQGLEVFKIRQPGFIFARGFFFFMAFTFYYIAYPVMPVADVVAVTFLAPVIVVLLSIVFLKENVSFKLWAAIIASFSGVLLVVGPSGQLKSLGTLLALSCAVTYAISSTVTRFITEGDRPITVAIYMMLILVVLSALTYWLVLTLNIEVGINPSLDFLVREWTWIIGKDGWLIIITALLASVGFYLHCRAYLIAPASHVSPFEYTYVLYAVVLAYAIFGEVPKQTTLLGLGILISSSLYIWYHSKSE